ncbi:hypothetical protein FB004_10357 [Sinorhizobium medicae]|nr:hypothetical protein FB004_10357 [Sinorhizobium medicae]
MPFKTILAVLGIPQTDRDLQTAADISNQVRAHLSVFIVGFAPQPTSRYATLASTWFEQRDWNLKALGETATTVRDKLSKREISFEVDSIYAEVAGATYDIGERALYSDLILMGPDAFQNADLKQQIITGGLIQSERPVLLIPPGPIPTLHPENRPVSMGLACSVRKCGSRSTPAVVQRQVRSRGYGRSHGNAQAEWR